jgi:hypothetical protein
MKPWQTGGLIAVGIYVLITLVLLPFGTPPGGLMIPYWVWASLPGMFLLNLINPENLSKFWFVVLSLPVYFCIGAIAGWVVGKIKGHA